MQPGFDFTELQEQLGPQYKAFLTEWLAFQSLLSARGRSVLQAGRILAGLIEHYGEQIIKDAVQISKAPGWQRALAMMEAYEWFKDTDLTDAQAAVLDAIIYRKLRRELRLQVFRWIREAKSAQEIDDLIDALRPPPGPTPPPSVTEADVRAAYIKVLEGQGYTVLNEQPTDDNGRADIVARRGDELVLCECKVDLDRKAAIYALGQLVLYSQTHPGAAWHIAYWRADESAGPVTAVCGGICKFHRVALTNRQPA